MSYNFNQHRYGDKFKCITTIIAAILFIGLIASVITLFVKLDRQTTVTTIGAEAYMIGDLDEAGKAKDGTTSIRTRNFITSDGLTVDIKDDAKVSYQLYFYTEKKEYISATADLTADYIGGAPETAKYAKVVITPTADEDGKVTLGEVIGYANQITVTVAK